MGLLPLALIVLPLVPVAPAAAQQTTDPSGGFRLEPTPTPSPVPGPVIAPLPTPAPAPSPTPRPVPTSARPPAAQPTPARSRPAATPTSRPVPRPTPAAPPVSARQTTLESSAATPLPEFTPTAQASPTSVSTPDIPAAAPVLTAPPASQENGARWRWIIALLVLAIGGAFWWWRRKRAQALRGETLIYEEAPELEEPVEPPVRLPETDGEQDFPAAPPVQTPVANPTAPPEGNAKRAMPKGVVTSGQRAAPSPGTIRAFSGLTGTPPPPPPTPAEPAPSGFVTTRKAAAPSTGRPQLGMQLEILGAEQTEAHFVLHYRLWMINEGPGTADSAVLRLDILPGGPNTQQQVDHFFLRQGQDRQTVTIPAMAPTSRTPVEGEMRVPLDPMITFRMNDRQMIIPLVAADLDYRWGGGQDRSQATFVLGRIGAAGQERLGPINIDLGPRIVRGIGAKPV